MARESVWLRDAIHEAQKNGACIVPQNDAELQRLRRAVKRCLAVSPVRGVFVGKQHWDDLKPRGRALLVMSGLQQLHPNWTFVGPSAAAAHGLWVSNRDLLPIRVATNWKAHGVSRGAVFRQCSREADVMCVNGLRCSSLLRTAFDCLREMDFCHGLAIADSTLRVGGIDREALVREIRRLDSVGRGSLHALETAAHADSRAQSGGESMSRAKMIVLGYELPELQIELQDVVDGGVYYGDFGWMRDGKCWLVGELDGHEKYVNPEMTKGQDAIEILSKERLRESRITAKRIAVMRFSFADMVDSARFAMILDSFEVPKSSDVRYEGRGKPFVPAGIEEARRRAKERWAV